MVLLDTDFLIDIMAGMQSAIALLEKLLYSPFPVTVSVISIMQLHHGIARSVMPLRERGKVKQVLDGLSHHAVTGDIAAHAGELDGELVSRGERIDPFDVLIGATALHYNEPLVTRNHRHFKRLPGLELLTYQIG